MWIIDDLMQDLKETWLNEKSSNEMYKIKCSLWITNELLAIVWLTEILNIYLHMDRRSTLWMAL